MKFEVKKLSISRGLLIFIAVISIVMVTAGIYVYFEKRKIEDEARQQDIKLTALKQKQSAYENRYSLLLSGAEINSLIRVVDELFHFPEMMEGFGKRVDSVDCAYQLTSQSFKCKMLVSSVDGLYASPEIMVNDSIVKPVISGNDLIYSEIYFPRVNTKSYDEFKNRVQIDFPQCNNVLNIFGFVSSLYNDSESFTYSTPKGVGELNEFNKGVNDNAFSGSWSFKGFVSSVPDLYFISETINIKEIVLTESSQYVTLTGDYTCTAN